MQEKKTVSTDYLDGLAKQLGLLTVILLVLSVSYDFNFLFALGLSFQEIPTELTDHVRSALVWIPQVGLVVLLIAIYEMAMKRVEQGKTEEEIIKSSSKPRFLRRFRQSAKVFAIFAATLTLVVISAFSLRPLYYGFMAIWAFLSLWIIEHPRLGKNFNSTSRQLFCIAPLVVAYVGAFGYSNGEGMLTVQEPAWELVLKTDVEQKNILAKGIRRFSQIAIIVDIDNQILIVPSANIIQSKMLKTEGTLIIPACYLFDVFCLENKQNDQQRTKTVRHDKP